jgi:hypothetical protein
MTMKRSSRSSANGFADTASGNPFAAFEMIADARKIQQRATEDVVVESARRIEQHADGMIKTILGTADLSTLEIPTEVLEQIIELLRGSRTSP